MIAKVAKAKIWNEWNITEKQEFVSAFSEVNVLRKRWPQKMNVKLIK